EEEYQSGGNVSRLKSYVRNYPSGAYMARAIGYLATDAFDNADDEQAIAYANRLIEEYPDSPGAEDGLAIKAEIMFGRGNIDEAYSAYSQLLRRTSSPVKLDVARMGMIRVARELKHWADIPENADVLLKSSILGDLQKNEAAFYKAEACEHLGNEAEAIKGYQALSANTDDVFGARASVALGELYLSTGNAKMAKKTAEKLVNSSSPHSYWVARGFILLSDANRAQGNIFEADEYITALRQNYPGSEQDIFMMIDQRLNR
ncbi:MAG: tetratricopeptide repeat protein, partial [Muribaculaceae bacterium]|nr:tetratricopeptide repeat protein [Muribaculaceae bacterium]